MAAKELKPSTIEQEYALAMNGFFKDGKFTREPDQVTGENLMVYDRGDGTYLIVYPTGGTAVMSKQMNTPEGVK